MSEDKKIFQETAKEEQTAEKISNEENKNPYLVVFYKPFEFEQKSYRSVDLSGLENLSAADMIAVNKIIERGGTVNALPEMSVEYACIFSAKATNMPVEFFNALPAREAIKVKKVVTNFLYGED